MRFLPLTLIILILTSCATKKDLENTYFSPPFTYSVLFSDGEFECEGELSFDGKELIFSPLSPQGYRVVLKEDGGRIEYEGLIFEENVLPSSRFLPLWDVFKNIEDAEIEENPLKIKKNNISIIFEEKK